MQKFRRKINTVFLNYSGSFDHRFRKKRKLLYEEHMLLKQDKINIKPVCNSLKAFEINFVQRCNIYLKRFLFVNYFVLLMSFTCRITLYNAIPTPTNTKMVL